MNNLPPPKSIKSFILSELIKGRTISEKELNWNSFRARLSDLSKDGLNIMYRSVKFKNSFGHVGVYREHYLPSDEKGKAIDLYKKLVETPVKV
jgi:hypothetical protein